MSNGCYYIEVRSCSHVTMSRERLEEVILPAIWSGRHGRFTALTRQQDWIKKEMSLKILYES